MTQVSDLVPHAMGIVSEETALDFLCDGLALIAQHYSQRDAKTKGKEQCLRRAARYVSDLKVDLKFAPTPLLGDPKD